MRTGAYGTPIPDGVCGFYYVNPGGEFMCSLPEGHEGGHRQEPGETWPIRRVEAPVHEAAVQLWMAYYSDFSGFTIFLSEIDALRYAVDRTMSVARIVPGQDAKEQTLS